MVKRRSFIVCLLLSIITFGIYGIYLSYCVGKETNDICRDDGLNQMNYVCAFLLGLVTLGIYPTVWTCTVMNRLRIKGNKLGFGQRMYSDTSYIVWGTVGLLILVGPFIAFHHFIAQINFFADVRPVPNGGSNVPPVRPQNNTPLRDSAPVGQKVVINNNNAPEEVDEVPETTPLDTPFSQSRTGTVTCEAGAFQGAEFTISEGEELIIGTNSELCNIVIDGDNSLVSGRHCSITFDSISNNYTVIDYSVYGTFLGNGERLNNAPKILPGGELIIIGDAKNAFRVG